MGFLFELHLSNLRSLFNSYFNLHKGILIEFFNYEFY